MEKFPSEATSNIVVDLGFRHVKRPGWLLKIKIKYKMSLFKKKLKNLPYIINIM